MGLKYKIINEKDLYSGFFKLKKIEFIHQKHDGSWTGQVDKKFLVVLMSQLYFHTILKNKKLF